MSQLFYMLTASLEQLEKNSPWQNIKIKWKNVQEFPRKTKAENYGFFMNKSIFLALGNLAYISTLVLIIA